MTSPLEEAVGTFVDEMTNVLGRLAALLGAPLDAEQKATADALNIVKALLASDGRYTHAELTALIEVFGPRSGPPLSTYRPNDLVPSYFVNAAGSLLTTSSLFDLVLAADAKGGTRYAWDYYLAAMRVAYAVVAIDFVPSEAELKAVALYRAAMWEKLEGSPVAETPNAVSPQGASAVTEEAPEPIEPEDIEVVMAELQALVGLDAVKDEVKLLSDFLRVQQLRKKHDLPVVEQSRHLVFTGNPGTGKTTVARLLARIYHSLGAIDGGQLIETDRSGMVAGYVGQTAIKVNELVASAIGGVLLIDEAYSLVRGSESDFGREAIDTLVKQMEDRRDDLVVIAAGYPEEMQTFINTNPGLKSRFPKTIHFEDYETDELMMIFKSSCARSSYVLSDGAEEALRKVFDEMPRDKGFGNARVVRNRFEASLSRQASRLVKTIDPGRTALMTLTANDVLESPRT